MTLLAVRPIGLAFLYGLAHPRPAAPVYDEPELPREVAEWVNPGHWVAGELPDLAPQPHGFAASRHCGPCDTSWTGDDPCWWCSLQPASTFVYP